MGIQEKAGDARISYTVESDRGFEDLVVDVEKKISQNGFKVLYVHDVQKTMQDKGFSFPGYKIIELCNARFAHEVLRASEEIGMFMPCKINVYERGGKRYISGMLPTLISQFFPNANLGSVPNEIELIIKKIIDEVK